MGTITPPPGATYTLGEPTLSGNVAFVSEGRYFERSGSTWVFRGLVRPLDTPMGTKPYGADYRGGLLIPSRWPTNTTPNQCPISTCATAGASSTTWPRLARAAVPPTSTSAATGPWSRARGFLASYAALLRVAPTLRAPAAIANDFEARDISGWQQEPGSQFALATTNRGIQYRQSSLADKATAFLTNSDRFNAQSIEADIIPRAINGSSWVGLALRYIDADNHYYVTLRNTNRLQLKRRSRANSRRWTRSRCHSC